MGWDSRGWGYEVMKRRVTFNFLVLFDIGEFGGYVFRVFFKGRGIMFEMLGGIVWCADGTHA